MLRWITGAWVLILCGVGALLVSEFPLAELFGSGSLGLRPPDQLVGRRHADRLALRRARRATAPPTGRWSLGTVGLSVMLGSVAIAPFLWIVCVTQLVGGVFDTFVNVAEETVRQQRTPDELRSRVFAAGEAIVVIAMSVSIAVGGPLIAAAGPRAAYALTGCPGPDRRSHDLVGRLGAARAAPSCRAPAEVAATRRATSSKQQQATEPPKGIRSRV